jgi:hypothetical protein
MCVYRNISLTSEVRVEMRMRSGHLPWARKDQTTKEIDLQKLFNDYWTSKEHKFIVPGLSWSPASPLISDREAQKPLPWGSIVALSSCTSLRVLPFVSLPPPIASANNTPIGRISVLIAQRSRRVVKGTLPNDGCTNGEGREQGY